MWADKDKALESALKQAVLRGDETAWRALYDQHFPRLWAYILYRSCRNREVTEELVQQCWETAVRRIESFDPAQGNFGQWLFGIANHLLRNDYRKRIRRDGLRPAAIVPADTAPSAPVSERQERIAVAYAMLPQRQQAVLRAKYEEQRSVNDIAGDWGESAKAVESLLSRARASFRAAYLALEKDY